MLTKIIVAILVGAIVWLASTLLGTVLVATTIPVLTTLGGFLVSFAIAIGALAGLWYYFKGGIPSLPE